MAGESLIQTPTSHMQSLTQPYAHTSHMQSFTQTPTPTLPPLTPSPDPGG